jgi:hypothetical protein
MTKEEMLQEAVSRAAELLNAVEHIEYYSKSWNVNHDWYLERDEWFQQLNYAHKIMEKNDH